MVPIPTKRYRVVIAAVIFVAILSSCGEPAEVDIPITRIPPATPTPTQPIPTEQPPPPPKTLVVCLAQEPTSLYLYASSSPEADSILQAIYDGPIDLRSYQYEPVILSKLPSFNDGDARMETLLVSEGQIYLNPETQLPDVLSPGKPFMPSGCTNPDCISEFQEGEVEMDRLVVDFELLPDIQWSDGEPLTAIDSVFSFNIDADDDTPSTKYLVHRTSSYEALDELHIRWSGIPGFLDSEFESDFWSPLPSHLLGDFSALELLSTEETMHFPIGWGPYLIDRWDSGKEIVLRKSETYFRSSEGFPQFDLLRIRFLDSDYVSALEQVLTGECDVLEESLISPSLWAKAIELAEDQRMNLSSIAGVVMQRIDFNVGSEGATTIFADVRMRMALATCLQREDVVENIFLGQSVVPDSYLPPAHPLHQTDSDFELPTIAEALELLEEVGWVDDDDDPQTPRVSSAVLGIPNGSLLEVNLFTTFDYFSEISSPVFEENAARCGFSIKTEFIEASELFEPWPNGPIFGGRFDLVSWAWPTFTSPPCEMFAGFEVPNVDNVFGVNATGFSDPDYDRACLKILIGSSSGDTYNEAIGTTESIFRDQMPSIPLYILPRLLAFGSEVCGPQPDPTTFNMLWNIEEYGSGESCEK